MIGVRKPSRATALRIEMFGAMRVVVDDEPFPRLRSRKTLWLLALLCVRHGRAVSREWLAGTLWPDSDQVVAFANLRPVLHELRKALGSQAFRIQAPDRATVSLDLDGSDVDLVEFDSAIRRGGIINLERAVELYSGPLLEGCPEEWAHQERNAREEDYAKALQSLADSASGERDFERAIGLLRRLVALDPLRGAARCSLMTALGKSGDINAALETYRDFERLLARELGASPDAETTSLYTRLRAALQRAPRPTQVDMAVVEVQNAVGHVPHTLTSLVGRADEQADLLAALRKHRLITLLGPGGIGKTRLALEVARTAAPEHPDGVWLIPFEALDDARLVALQTATVLGIKEETACPLAQSIVEFLRQKRLLLVLDNCEHVLAEAARLATHILSECGGVRILTSSRGPLGVTGETVWSVLPLTSPDPASLPTQAATLVQVVAGFESVQLFLERAQAVRRSFVLSRETALPVAQICHQLEGIPLAIELAAARVNSLDVAEIASRLNERLNLLTTGSRTALLRQQTLRASLDWSHSLLTQDEQRLFRRLALFSGGWSLEAAEHVCVFDGVKAAEVRDLLSSLIDQSLVVFGEDNLQRRHAGTRYRLLETVRQYAAEQLASPSEVTDLKANHRDYYLQLAESIEPRLTEADQGTWLRTLESERENLRAALESCVTEPDAVLHGLKLACALGRFWEMSGAYSEGRAWLSQVLHCPGAESKTSERAKALNSAGTLANYQGDLEEAWTLHDEALAISRDLEDWECVAWSLNHLGDLCSARSEDGDAERFYLESLEIFRRLGNLHGIASLLHHIGRVIRDRGEYDRAKHYYLEGLSVQRELGDGLGIAWALHHLGNLAGVQGDIPLAWSLQEESLSTFRDLGNGQGAGWSLSELGNVAMRQGNLEAAAGLYEQSISVFRELGNKLGIAVVLTQTGQLLLEQGESEAARKAFEQSRKAYADMGSQQGMLTTQLAIDRLAGMS